MEHNFQELSIVNITEEDILYVSKHSGASVNRIKEYLKGDDQDDNILKGFALLNVYPCGKFFK